MRIHLALSTFTVAALLAAASLFAADATSVGTDLKATIALQGMPCDSLADDWGDLHRPQKNVEIGRLALTPRLVGVRVAAYSGALRGGTCSRSRARRAGCSGSGGS